jgi:hypothetical protein
MRVLWACGALFLFGATGCVQAHLLDAGAGDAGASDAGASDAGTSDAGAGDAGTDADAGDAGEPMYHLEGGVSYQALIGVGTSNMFELACGPDEIAIGHGGGEDVAGAYPYWYALRCAQLQSDGSWTGERSTPVVASNPGLCGHMLSAPWTQDCPAGEVPVGVHGATVIWAGGTEVIGRIGLVCAAIAQWVRDGTGATSLPVTTSNSYPSVEDFDVRCPAGQVVTAMSGYDGCLIDGLRIGCRALLD